MAEMTLNKVALYLGVGFLLAVFLLPPLCPIHLEPLTSFWTEWFAGLLMLACFTFVFMSSPRELALPRALWLWLVWGLSLVFSVIANHYDLWQPVIFEGISWAMGLLSLLAGAQLVAKFGRERILIISAYGLFVAGLLQAVLGVARYYGLLANLSIYLRPLPSARMDGLLNYPTLQGFSLWLSICAMLYLFVKGRLNWLVLACSTLIMTIPIIATGDRSTVLYWGGLTFISIVVVAGQRYRRHGGTESGVNGESGFSSKPELNKKRVLGAVAIISFALVCSIPLYKKIDAGMTSYMVSQGFPERNRQLSKLYSRRGHFWGIRSSAFRKAFYLAEHSPFFGIGPGNYTYQGFLLNTKIKDSLREGTIDTHTHNIFSMLLAENGSFGLLVLIVGCILILRWWWLLGPSAEAIFIGSVLADFFTYSNLEYPLWYLNLLVIFMVFCGFLSPQRLEKLDLAVIKPLTAVVIATLGGILGWRAFQGYSVISSIPPSKLASMADAKKLQKLFSNPFWAAEAGTVFEQVTIPTKTDLSDQIDLAQQVIEFMPTPPALIHKVVLLEFDGKHDQACQLATEAANSYPSAFDGFKRIRGDYKVNDRKMAIGFMQLEGCFYKGYKNWQSQWKSSQ